MAKIGWNDVCLPFDEGDLGIRPLHLKNKGLFLKWLWCLRNCCSFDFWFEVVSSSLSITSWQEFALVSDRKLSHIWRSIRKTRVRNDQRALEMLLGVDVASTVSDCWRRNLRSIDQEELQQLMSAVGVFCDIMGLTVVFGSQKAVIYGLIFF